jgi:hypothetical protein
MSGWHELKAERNRQSLARLNKALPTIFPWRSVASAQPPIRAADAMACNRIVLRRPPAWFESRLLGVATS